MGEATALIEALDLAPHPEGGWYRETWRADAPEGERPSATAILFLLEAVQSSHWHAVDAAELWFWHAGSPLRLMRAASDSGPSRTIIARRRCARRGSRRKGVIPPHHWQAAEAARWLGARVLHGRARGSISPASRWPRPAGQPGD
jgi:predicted cupin superfamily sugar epimerase